VNIIVNIPINNLKGNNYGKAVIGNYTMPIAAVAIPITPDNTDMPYCPPIITGWEALTSLGAVALPYLSKAFPR
jgi:hypothetical protein